MKRQAESFLMFNCPNTIPIILRPSFVWHEKERNWTVPLAYATNFGNSVRENIVTKMPGGELLKNLFPPTGSLHLEVLAEYAIRGALGELDGKNESCIWSNDVMNAHKGI